MQTMVIRIGEAAKQSGSRYYPLSLHIDDGNTPDWAERPVARMALPADLTPAPGLDVSTIKRVLPADNAPQQTLTAVGRYLYQLLAENVVGAAWIEAAEAYQAGANGSGRLRGYQDIDATDAVLAHAQRIAAKGRRATREERQFAARDEAAGQSLLALLTADEDG